MDRLGEVSFDSKKGDEHVQDPGKILRLVLRYYRKKIILRKKFLVFTANDGV